MLSKEERELRKSNVGASDVPHIMNFDLGRAHTLYRQKLGEIEIPELNNKYIVFGNITEEDCLKFYFESNGIKNYTLNERIEHPRIKNFVASTDGITGITPIENKGKNENGWLKLKKPEKDHVIQVTAQMACLQTLQGKIIYNRATEEDYEHPILYEPSKEKQKVFTIDLDEKLLKEIELRVQYFLECLQDKTLPDEAYFKGTYL